MCSDPDFTVVASVILDAGLLYWGTHNASLQKWTSHKPTVDQAFVLPVIFCSFVGSDATLHQNNVAAFSWKCLCIVKCSVLKLQGPRSYQKKEQLIPSYNE